MADWRVQKWRTGGCKSGGLEGAMCMREKKRGFLCLRRGGAAIFQCFFFFFSVFNFVVNNTSSCSVH